MAKTSKTIPQKENASSSRLAGGKTPAEPRPEECVPRGCVLTSNFKTDKASSILDRCEPVSRYICSINEGYPKQDKKRKKTSPSEDPEPKKKAARKPRKNIILLTKEFVRRLREEDDKEEEDDSRMVARVGMSIEAPKATESVKAAETSSRDEGVSGRDFREVPKSSRIKEAPNHTEPMMIQEARALKTLSIEGAHGSEDPFHDYFTGVEDTIGLSDLEVSRKDLGEASSLCSEAQQALNRVSPNSPCLRASSGSIFSVSSRADRYEADIQRLTEERNALNLIGKQKEEQIKDLLAELATAHKDQTDLVKQKKVERIEQFREEVNIIKAESLEWKEGMDCFATEKETTRAQLSSVKSQLQAEKAKVEADVIVAIYRADAEATQVQAREIVKARELEAETGALASSDDDDDDGSKSESENGEDLDGEEAAPGENYEPYDFSLLIFCIGS
uniref:Uncharacterized protein n=1 Tax=Nicotiana tabacum TaxID=4097 RepID=A0A1S3YED3_TOBAC|nr:PREDICTED: uncharacterized protein LOC107775397 [Nicotiana tabacum]